MYSSVDTIWVLLGAALVFFMQAGFAMVETGFTRAKNAGNIIMKNLMDFACGSLVFWIFGFGLMFAGSGKLIGGLDFFIQANYGVEGGYPSWAYGKYSKQFSVQLLQQWFQRAMAERTKFKSVFSLFNSNTCIYLSYIRSLDLGWRLASSTRIYRFCRINCSSYGRWSCRISRS